MKNVFYHQFPFFSTVIFWARQNKHQLAKIFSMPWHSKSKSIGGKIRNSGKKHSTPILFLYSKSSIIKTIIYAVIVYKKTLLEVWWRLFTLATNSSLRCVLVFCDVKLWEKNKSQTQQRPLQHENWRKIIDQNLWKKRWSVGYTCLIKRIIFSIVALWTEIFFALTIHQYKWFATILANVMYQQQAHSLCVDEKILPALMCSKNAFSNKNSLRITFFVDNFVKMNSNLSYDILHSLLAMYKMSTTVTFSPFGDCQCAFAKLIPYFNVTRKRQKIWKFYFN